jgi:hypothetical protein
MVVAKPLFILLVIDDHYPTSAIITIAANMVTPMDLAAFRFDG